MGLGRVVSRNTTVRYTAGSVITRYDSGSHNFPTLFRVCAHTFAQHCSDHIRISMPSANQNRSYKGGHVGSKHLWIAFKFTKSCMHCLFRQQNWYLLAVISFFWVLKIIPITCEGVLFWFNCVFHTGRWAHLSPPPSPCSRSFSLRCAPFGDQNL